MSLDVDLETLTDSDVRPSLMPRYVGADAYGRRYDRTPLSKTWPSFSFVAGRLITSVVG